MWNTKLGKHGLLGTTIVSCFRCFAPNRLFSKQARTVVQATKTAAVSRTRASTITRPCFHHYRNDDNVDATALVDGLIRYTQELMTESKSRHHIVAYSGGVDSSLVTCLLQHATAAAAADPSSQPPSWQQTIQVQAVLGISPAVSQEQVQVARQVASHLQVPLREVHTTEGTDQVYIENKGQACFACKSHLYESLEAVHRATSSITSSSSSCRTSRQRQQREDRVQLYNGTNANDLEDSTRVGLIAANHFDVLSPLQFTTKKNVRKAAKHLGLPNWNAAAAPCLRSRLALGVEATQGHLHMIERAERFVRNSMLRGTSIVRGGGGSDNDDGLLAAHNVRVRMLANRRAMIEVDEILLNELRLGEEEERFFQSLGFASVSARPFKTGSVARVGTSSTTTTRLETTNVVVGTNIESPTAAVG